MEELKRMGDGKLCTSALILRDKKLLLGLRHYTPEKWKTVSVWTTPGGRCDEGESVEVGLRRETFEEVGINDLNIEQFVGEYNGAKTGDLLLVFLCRTAQEPELKEPEKFSEWRWFNVDEIPENFINPFLIDKIKELAG